MKHIIFRSTRSRVPKKLALLLLLFATCLPAWAADYVIKSGNYYIGMNAAGTALEAKTVIDESCIWTTTNALSTTSQSVQNKKNTGKYLVASCTRTGSFSYTYSWTLEVGTSASAVWRGNGGNFYAYYEKTGSGSWNRSASLNATSSSSITLSDNNTTNSQYYSVSQGIDDGVTYYQETGQYVITSANAHFLGGTSTTDITTFSPSTCLWTGTSGGTWKNSAGYYLRMQRSGYAMSGYTYTMSLSQTNSSEWNLTGTESGTTGQRLDDDTYDRYVRYNSEWTTTNSNTDNVTNVVFAVTKRTYLEQSTNPIISGDATFTATGSKTYTSSGESYIPGYINYIFYNNNNHYFKTDNSTSLSVIPTTSESFTYAWSLSANASGHVSVNNSGQVSYNTYYNEDTDVTLTLTATSTSGKVLTATKTITFESPKTDPTGITATIDKTIIFLGETANVSYTLQGTPCYDEVTFSSSNTSIATVDEHTGVVTAVSVGTATITATAHPYTTSGTNKTATVTVTVKDKCAIPTISFSNITEDGATATLATTTTGATIFYTINGSDPTASSTAYTAPFSVEPGDEVRAIAIVTGTDAAYWLASDVLTRTYSSCKVATPSILIDGDGKISFTCPEEGTVTYKYCISTDGSCTPTTTWNGTPIAKNLSNNEKIIKVIATNDDCLPSDPATRLYTASGTTTGGTVYLNDYEDHTWTYYAGVPSDVDGGNYNTNYVGKMYSPNPRNVKITYQANGGQVSISESETEFVYYKTIEKVNNAYKYQVISNPFSKRPTGKGFGGWEVVSGGSYIGKTDGAVLALDEELTLTGLDNNYTVNCTSAEIVLKATWVDANVTTITSNPTSNQTYSFTGGTYETNFIVLKNVNYTRTMTINSPCTIMMVEPDGSADYRNSYTFSGYITPADLHDNGKITKIEFAHWTPGNNGINPQGRNFTIGRGMTMDGTARTLYGSNSNVVMNQVLIVESGTFSGYRGCNTKPSSHTKQIVVFGNDYDRAKKDNDKLSITGSIYGLTTDQDMDFNDVSKDLFHITTKSGKFYSTASVTDAAYNRSFYLFDYSQDNNGTRTLVIEGGEFGHIAGGANSTSDDATVNAVVNLKVRMKGGTVNGSIYGGAAQYNCSGSKQFVFTGGTVKGWIAGGSNGYSSGNQGSVTGASYVYIGGNTQVNSNGDNTVRNAGVGGTVYGAGCGQSSTATSGRVALGTNVVVADNAYVERGVYGGGSFGYCPTDKTSNIYITGGEVGGNPGAINRSSTGNYSYSSDITGGVYGGACQNSGGAVNIYMTGGLVNGGLYGGSNVSGTINQNVSIVVTGGQVGTSTNNANIHGGGYGASTTVSQNVDVTLGTRNTTTGVTSGSAVVYGDVYGGSALGKVNGTSATTTYKTNVTLNAGTINGSLYGGALGNSTTAANVYGPVAVKVYGGSVNTTTAVGSGAVYGCNNVNGAPQGTVSVDIYGTDPAPADGYALDAVYGGGNMADYAAGTPTVKVHNCNNSIGSVYGGGNAADITGTGHGTSVTIYGGNVIGNVFGGGNGEREGTEANVTGNVSVNVYGGTILNVYGGSNTKGTIGGTISVTVNSQAETSGGTACPMAIDNVYGGGNKAASNAGSITIGCTGPYVAASETAGTTESGYIRNVYGGANQANITGDIGLNIKAGHIDNVFGGNNNSGLINGTITVTVKEDNSCDDDMLIGNVYGGGNLASYGSGSNYPVVKIEKGHLTGSVFGGGKGSATDATHATGAVTGNPQVTIGSTTITDVVTIDGNVFGGGDAANVIGSPEVLVQNCNTKIGTTSTTGGVTTYTNGSVYGGGNAAHVTGSSNSTSVTINGGTINRVFGGGNGEVSAANVEGNANTTIHGGKIHQAFAGSNAAGTISGTAKITVDKTGSCDEKIDELYGGGNLAEGNAGTVTVACGAIVDDVYGGANQAKVTSDITLNITGGTIKRVFGGNNTSGNITGAITVNINKATDCSSFSVENVYGAGNQASYTPTSTGSYPAVNIKNGTVTYDVFGGGLGSTATVTSNPTVVIDGGTVGGNVFGGGSEAGTVGTTSVTVKTGTVSKDVYGGGALANVTGNTTVSLTGGTVTGNTYGGGLGRLADAENSIAAVAAMVTGNTTVTVNGGKSNNVFGCNNLNGGPQGEVKVTVTTGTITNNVYGGGNQAAAAVSPLVTVNGGTMKNVYGGGLGSTAVITGSPVVTINKTATDMTVVDVFGGGDAAAVQAPTSGTSVCTVNMQAGSVSHIYGGGNQAGVNTTDVNVSGGAITDGLYGGCNTSGTVTGTIAVDVTGGTIGTSSTPANVHGGGYGSATATGGNVAVTINGSSVTICGDVYGGSALGNVNDASTETTTVTLTNGTINGNLYGGGLGDADNAAGVAGKTVVSVTGGTVNNVFGCNNVNGKPVGGAAVTVSGGTINDNVYGGGNLAAASVSPVVTINGGTMDNVYGGGLGSTAVITGSPVVTINKTATSMTVVDVFGGGDAAAVQAPTSGTSVCTVNMQAGSVSHIYGGGNQAGVSTTDVNVSGGAITGGLYGGCNTSGTVTGAIAVDVTGGTIGTSSTSRANVHGGGYGYQTETGGNVAVTINGSSATIYGDVYGGSALGSVNDATTETTTVTLTSGTINGDLYGGGLGNTTYAAGVTGSTVVAINGGTVNNVFGCNNANGAPATGATVTVNGGTINNNVYGGGNLAAASVSPVVNIYNGTLPGSVFGGGKGDASDATHAIAMITGNPQVTIGTTTGTVTIAGNVFGGGDAANVQGTTKVTVNNCNTFIGAKTSGVWSTTAGTVYGGGNAADVVKNGTTGGSTSVIINGGDIYRVFGGGNGEGTDNPGANVANGTNVEIHAGNIHQAFAGSNAKGNITGTSLVTIDHDVSTCDELIDEVYGGGNLAAGNAGAVTVECGAVIGDLYGGANQADIGTSTDPCAITLNVTGGTINRVFGGNNTSGNVTGKITVNINKADDCSTFSVGTVYGAGNQAAYTPTTGAYPEVNILKGKVTNDVFGGGLGASATVTSSPVVNVNGGNVGGDVYGGGSLASVTGSTTVNLKNANSTVTGNIYGGGLGCNDCGTSGAAVAANVSGSTSVNISLGTVSNVFGCNNIYGAPSTGATVTVTGGTISNNVYGGGNLAAASVSPVVNIYNGTLPGSVFGGGLGSTAIITGSPQVTIGSSTSTDEVKISGNVFGGGDAANVEGSPKVTVNKCNTMIGTKTSGEWNTTGGTVYGGGNAADVVKNGTTGGSTSVIINGGDIYRVFGGGNGEGTDNPGANVANGTNVEIHAGNIHQAFAGSNTAGYITGTANITIDHDVTTCDELVDELYGGGNVAEGNAGSVNIECGAVIGKAFGGANNANVNSGITLNITGGSIANLFGGNNNGGTISGKIVVNVDWESSCTDNYLGNVYGGGNVAAYAAPASTPDYPQVNIRNAEVEYDVFGGGLGTTAVVTGNPQVNINTSDCSDSEHTTHSVTVKGSVYGGGSAAAVIGNPKVLIKGAEGDDNTITVKAHVFGGGLGVDAATNGNTTVRIEGNTTIEGNVYGGGNAGEVEGNTDVQIGAEE